jgi:hypothetical protein
MSSRQVVNDTDPTPACAMLSLSTFAFTCAGAMVVKPVETDPSNGALEHCTYVCAECGHSRTYSVDGGDS